MLDNTGKYAIKHGTGKSNGGGATIIINNGTSDVPLNLNVDSVVANTADIGNITARNIDVNNNLTAVHLTSGDGYITDVRGIDLTYENGNIKNLDADNISTRKLEVTDTATIRDLIASYIQAEDITTDTLTVTKQAHFFELVIDKIRSSGGTEILTAANCVLDYVEAYNSSNQKVELDANNVAYYRCYWRKTDSDGKTITNDWLPNDQAICQTFNVSAGVNYNVSNTYYWRLVNNTNDNAHVYPYVNFNTKEVLNHEVSNYQITLSNLAFTVTKPNSDTFDNNGYICTNFDITPDTGVTYASNIWTVESITDGLRLTMLDSNDQPITLTGGTFSFNTNTDTRLNVTFYYEDNTIDYFAAPDTYSRSYSCSTGNDKVAAITAIRITSATIETWEPCNWIDLSNTDQDDTGSIPDVGDNVVQLGYRYGANPTKMDKARASAIILAATASPDNGDTTTNPVIPAIVPPSYAQYKNITNYHLAAHRHSYFDANGAKFYGSFYVGPDSDNTGDYTPIDDLEAEVYKIVPSYDIITKDINDVITPSTLTCQFMVPNQSSLSASVPTGCTFNWWKDNVAQTPISAGNNVSLNISSISTNVILQLVKDNVIVDQVTKSVVEIDVANGTNGLNGSYTEYAYKNGTTAGSLPTNNTDINNLDNGWSKTASTPSSGQYTWCTDRTNYYTLTNNIQTLHYGNWSTAYRITGETGKPGEDGDPGVAGADGKYTEFIYQHTTGPMSFTGTGNPVNWYSTTGTYQYPDYVGPAGTKWTDHPQGIGTINGVFYEYEYMSQRQYDGTSFESFITPVIWSRWGQNGMDGDGYEYVYLKYNSDVCPTIYDNDTYDGKNKTNDDYLPYSYLPNTSTKLRWSDNPSGVDSSYMYEFVSVRKKEDGQWGNFSTGSLWAKYSKDGQNGQDGATGPTGPTGPTGAAGQNGQSVVKYELEDQGSSANLAMNLDSSNNITYALSVSLNYRVIRREGTSTRYMNANEMSGMNVYYRMYKKDPSDNINKYYYSKLPLTTSGDNIAQFSGTYTSSNAVICQENKNVVVALLSATADPIYDNNVTDYTNHDTTQLQVVLAPIATFQVIQGQEASIRTLVAGQTGLSQQYSTLSQTMSGIQADVSSVTSDLGTLNVDYSSFKQSSQQFQTTVTNKLETTGNARPNLIKLSMLENKDKTFGPNTTIDTITDNTYWYTNKNNGNNVTFNNFVQNTTYMMMGNHCLYMTTSYFDYNSSSQWADMRYRIDNSLISYDPVGQEYCFSVYARNQYATGNANMTLHISGLASNSSITGWTTNEPGVELTNDYDRSGTELWQMFKFNDQDWHRIYVTFKPYVTTTNPVCSIRIYRTGGVQDDAEATQSWFMSMPKCEKGTVPSIWTPASTSDTVMTSEITQTANQISLSVNQTIEGLENGIERTGIDITNGKITISANNTDIDGNLNLYDDDNNGITIYDENNIPRVNLQSDSITNITPNVNDTFSQFSITSYSTGSTYNVTTYSHSLGTVQANRFIDLSKVTLDIHSGSSSAMSYPSELSVTVQAVLRNGTTEVMTANLNLPRAIDNTFHYIPGKYSITSSSYRFFVTEAGTYNVIFKVSGLNTTPSGGTITSIVTGIVQTGTDIQTYIGRDGMYSHSGPNKILENNDKHIILQHGIGGIKVEQYTDGYGRIYSGVPQEVSNQTIPNWISFYNYTPIQIDPDLIWVSATDMWPVGTAEYAYYIDPTTQYGDILISKAYIDTNYNERDQWIFLPPHTYTVNGTTYDLPIGWRITIINGLNKNNTTKGVYVAPNEYSARIIDSNRDEQTYARLNSTYSNSTFIYVGTYGSSTPYWRQLEDTQ